MRPASTAMPLLDIVARDAAGLPLAGLDASARFERPTDRRLDHAVSVSEDQRRPLSRQRQISSGQWDLVIEAVPPWRAAVPFAKSGRVCGEWRR